MKREILLAATVVTLVMSGCAQKKVTSATDGYLEADNGGVYTDNTYTGGDTISAYDNVDPYGNGNYGTNGAVGNANGSNGGYANGGYGDKGYGNGNGGVQNVYFEVDQYNITPEKLSTVSNNARLLRPDVSAGAKIKVEGHCDASGTDEYNYALGLRRAKASKDTLVTQGIPASNVSLVSMGESSPECMDGASADCYSKNRRVEFKVLQ